MLSLGGHGLDVVRWGQICLDVSLNKDESESS